MRPVRDMETIQIEITNACTHACSNCTRLVGHHKEPYYMDLKYFKKAVKSLDGYLNMVGVMGGEPLLHPQFEEISKYLHSKVPPERCGLWTSFPKGKEKYAKLISEVYGDIFLNDHTRDDILHFPILIDSKSLELDEDDKWYMIDNCFAQNQWSASINPKGAFFCEIAASLAMVMQSKTQWDITTVKDWWGKAPIDYVDQMREFCTLCGLAMPLKRRFSIEGKDDISKYWFNQLKEASPKLKAKKYVLYKGKLEFDNRQLATYKDDKYRKEIAARYGMMLVPNERGYYTPIMNPIGGKKT